MSEGSGDTKTQSKSSSNTSAMDVATEALAKAQEPKEVKHDWRAHLGDSIAALFITFQLTFLAWQGVISPDDAFLGLTGIAAGYGYYKVRKGKSS